MSKANDHYASNTLAQIARDQWEDYLKRFVPEENALMGQTTYANPGIVNSEISQGQSYVGQAIDATFTNKNKSLFGYGVQTGSEYNTVNERMRELSKTAALADAANNIRQRLVDRNNAIATGGTTSSTKYTLDSADIGD